MGEGGQVGLRSLLSALIVVLTAGATQAQAPAPEEGNFLTNMFKYGGTTVPPSQPKDLGEPYCPQVDVPEGGAALRSLGGRAGDNAAVRNQITLGRLARECTKLQDGSVAIKVGIAGQVLLGPAGAPGRFEAPVQIAIKYGDTIIASRSKKVAVSVAPGEAQGLFTLVEDGFVVPRAMSEDYDIVVSLGSGSAKPAARSRRKPASASAAPEGAGAAQ